VVLNPSSDKLDDFEKAYPDLEIRVLKSSAGVNSARNQGLKESRSDLLIFLDDDCWISNSSYLNAHEQLHRENPHVLAIGGYYKTDSRAPLARAYHEIQTRWLQMNCQGRFGFSRTLLGGNFSLKKAPFSFTFDPTILYGGSETEFFLRLGSQGHQFLLVDLPVEHDPKLSGASFARKARLQGRTHRMLIERGLLAESSWIFWNSQELRFYHSLYRWFFGGSIQKDFGFHPFLRLKAQIKKWHLELCFYLSNRDLF
jgi:glycosyltransferase involved in cell wall biosynthesis